MNTSGELCDNLVDKVLSIDIRSTRIDFVFDAYLYIENSLKDYEHGSHSQSRAIRISYLGRATSLPVDCMEHILAIEQQQQNKVTTAAERATSRHAPVLLWSRIGGRWCWWRISSALPMCSYSRTPVERPPSPATIPLIRPYFV